MATQTKFVQSPHIRKTLYGQGSDSFEVVRHVQQASENEHGLQNTQWFMKSTSDPDQKLSPWHDIPLRPSSEAEFPSELNNLCSGVIEISKKTVNKMECSKEIAFNPITQDVTIDKVTGKAKLRQYSRPPRFNYGFIPQTWCDPKKPSSDRDAQGLLGDGDGLDLVDISQYQLKPLLAVSDYIVLGVLGLVDQGELDAKIIAMEINEAADKNIRSLSDYKRQNPGALKEIYEWFRDYKTWEGKAKNEFIWGGEILDDERALEMIHESNQMYHDLVNNPPDDCTYWLGQQSEASTSKLPKW